MAYDGSGNYSLPPGSIVSDGTTIDAADHNTPVTDIAAALNQVLLRSGVAPMTGDLDLGGHNVINAGVSGGTFLTEDDIGTSGHKIPRLDVNVTWSGHNSFTANVALGSDTSDIVSVYGTYIHPTVAALFSSSTLTALRTNLGLGTAATQSITFDGGAVPTTNFANTFTTGQAITTASSVVPLSLIRPASASLPSLYSNLTGADGTGYYQAWFLANGGIVGSITQSILASTTGSVAYNTTSDDRLKRASTPLVDSGAIIDQLAPIRFRWGRDDGPEDFGFSAQALHAVVPQAVTPGKGEPGDKDFVPWMIEHGRLEAILVAEIKALRARVAAFEARVAALEAALP
jgi:hypothetical protein